MNALESDKHIIVHFPAGTGGKFLINCLGLSKNSTFLNKELTKQQLVGNFSPQDKLNYLKNKLQNVTDSWSDLDLFSDELLGTTKEEFVYKNDHDLPIQYNEIIYELNKLNRYYFFSTSHDIEYTHALINQSKNAKIILFENFEEFLVKRLKFTSDYQKLNDDYNAIRGKSWSDMPVLLNDLVSFDSDSLKEFLIEFPYEFKRVFDKIYDIILHNYKIAELKKEYSSKIIIWDTKNYFQSSDTINGIRNLYNDLELPDFNESMIGEYYTLWAEKIQKCNHVSVTSRLKKLNK